MASLAPKRAGASESHRLAQQHIGCCMRARGASTRSNKQQACQKWARVQGQAQHGCRYAGMGWGLHSRGNPTLANGLVVSACAASPKGCCYRSRRQNDVV
ncbi:hypothetical protein PS2_035232 [Malus domestica]